MIERRITAWKFAPAAIAAWAMLGCASPGPATAQNGPKQVAGAPCGVSTASAAELGGNATDPKTGRSFFLEYPCDIAQGEDLTFILNIHGAGSRSGWQRRYFPASDYVEKYRLIVATPTAATAEPIRRWTAEADDEYLQNITELVTAGFGRDNVRAFWLAGHSQGGLTSHRIICSDYFQDKVDGMVSIAGGRLGQGRYEEALGCEMSYVFTTGDLDSSGRAGVPTTSPVADRYKCATRIRTAIIEDSVGGKVSDTRTAEAGRPDRPGWGGLPGPGTSDVYQFPDCEGGRVVADVIRLNKGHTEGLEPRVTEEIVRLIVSAPGGKLRAG